MSRISDVLDDMLAVDSVASRVKNRLRSRVLMRGRARSDLVKHRHQSFCEVRLC